MKYIGRPDKDHQFMVLARVLLEEHNLIFWDPKVEIYQKGLSGTKEMLKTVWLKMADGSCSYFLGLSF